MKKSRLPFAGALALIACAAQTPVRAQGSGAVVLYGRLNIALEHMRNTRDGDGRSASVTRASNDRSVLGFRGSEELGDGARALFQVEGTLSPDTGAGSIAARD